LRALVGSLRLPDIWNDTLVRRGIMAD